MLFRASAVHQISSCKTAYMQEPNAGIVIAVVELMQKLPKDAEGNTIGGYFGAMRILSTLYVDQIPWIWSLMDNLHSTWVQNPLIEVLQENPWLAPPEEKSILACIKQLNPEHAVKLLDVFIQSVGVQDWMEMNDALMDEIWPNKEKTEGN